MTKKPAFRVLALVRGLPLTSGISLLDLIY